MTIGGNITVKNSFRWDYCLEQCIDSLLPICEVVNVVDSDSDDETKSFLEQKAAKEPRIRVLNYPWPNVVGDRDCILTKMNWGRERLGTDYHLHLEADEVLGSESYETIQNAASVPGKVLAMTRLNFWLDAQHLLAPGFILSPLVIRFAPTVYYLGGDAPHPLATQTEPNADWGHIHKLKIYHYGFLRKTAAYVEKYRDLMVNINSSDRADPHTMDLLAQCAQDGSNWMEKFHLPTLPYNGQHPASMIPWLKERGYDQLEK